MLRRDESSHNALRIYVRLFADNASGVKHDTASDLGKISEDRSEFTQTSFKLFGIDLNGYVGLIRLYV